LRLTPPRFCRKNSGRIGQDRRSRRRAALSSRMATISR
jgi:hypothetical protein